MNDDWLTTEPVLVVLTPAEWARVAAACTMTGEPDLARSIAASVLAAT